MSIEINDHGISKNGVLKIPMDVNDKIVKLQRPVIYGTILCNDETFSVVGGKIDFKNGDVQDDPFDILQLDDCSIHISNDGIYQIQAMCSFNTDQTDLNDGGAVEIYKNGEAIGNTINGSYSAVGGGSGEEIKNTNIIISRFAKDDIITFSLVGLSNDKIVIMNSKILINSLEIF